MADGHKAKAEAMLGRSGYARGGATKGKHTTVNVVVASPPAGGGGAMPPHPPMMPPPAGAMPPHPPMPAPAPPMAGPPGAPPPGMMPPGPRARGGSTPYVSGKAPVAKKTAVDALRAAGYKTGGAIDDGAGSGEGRLEKIKAYGGRKK